MQVVPNKYRPLPKFNERNVRNFHAKVAKGEPDSCWPWTGARFHHGYGAFRAQGGNWWCANRVAYLLATGVDPGDMLVCHSCDNPPCCNPAHLSLGTALDNQRQSWARGRRRADGENSNRAILGWKEVAEIRADYAAGKGTQREIGERYGVSRSAIRSVVNYENWNSPTAVSA